MNFFYLFINIYINLFIYLSIENTSNTNIPIPDLDITIINPRDKRIKTKQVKKRNIIDRATRSIENLIKSLSKESSEVLGIYLKMHDLKQISNCNIMDEEAFRKVTDSLSINKDYLKEIRYNIIELLKADDSKNIFLYSLIDNDIELLYFKHNYNNNNNSSSSSNNNNNN